jgi:hypothetical protein
MRNNIARLGIETLEQRDNPSGWSFWSDDPNWSFWNDNYVGAFLSGGAQGVVNIINGVQDAVIAIPNLVPTIYNITAGNLGAPRMGYIPSPDWSRDLIYVGEPTHGLSKFVGGQGAFLLLTMGASSIGSASEVTHLTTAEEAAAIRAEGIIRGTNGVFASTTVYSTYTANSVATLVPGLSGQVRITGQAASLFQPVKVVGPISAWTRIGAGAYYAPFTNINLATGTATPIGFWAQWPVVVDAGLGLGLQLGIQNEQGSLDW